MVNFPRYLIAWLPPLLWMGLIFFLSSFHQLQASAISWQDFVTRKLAHLLEYAVLSVLLYRALQKTAPWSKNKSLVVALLAAVVYSLSDEYHQTLVAGRTGKFLDVGIDSLGALIGAIWVKKWL